METSKVDSSYWKCSVCHELTDGKFETGGDISISRRCFHIFHDSCIKKWIKDCKDTCPNCNLEHFSSWEVLPNPDYIKQYKKWQADPQGYSFEKAFEKEYGCSSKSKGLEPEVIIRPKDLRDKPQNRKLNYKDIQEYYKDRNEKVQALNEKSTQEEIAKAIREADQGHHLQLDYLIGENAKHFADFKQINEKLDAEGKKSAHRKLISFYKRKVEKLEKRLEQKEKALEKEKPVPRDKITNLIKTSLEIGKFSRRFSEAGEISHVFDGKPSIEESQILLKKVDEELEIFIAKQPEEILEILNQPIQEEEEHLSNSSIYMKSQQKIFNNPKESSNLDNKKDPQQKPENHWPSNKTMFKVAIVVVGIFVLYVALHSETSKDFFDRHWKNLT